MGALRKTMKWTTVTFTVGWLAIAGIPPLAGFWSKGDVLDNVYAHYKLLWALGLLTAVLTAYYMTRLEVLAFGGDPRWDKVGPHGEPALHAPHESPWIMRLPSWSWPSLAFFAGLLDLPWIHHDSFVGLAGAGLRRQPLQRPPPCGRPVGPGPDRHRRGHHRPHHRLRPVARRPRSTSPQLEPQFLQRVWYWDDFYDAVIGRPSQKLATFFAWVVDARIIDGAVNGAATSVRSTGSAARKLQTGLRAQLRPGHRPGPGRPDRLPAQPDVVVMSHSVPFLTLLIILPAAGGARPGPPGPGQAAPQGAAPTGWPSLVSLATLVVAVVALVTMKVHFGGFQLVSNHTYTGRHPGHPLVSSGSTGSRSSWSCCRPCCSRWSSSPGSTSPSRGPTPPGCSCSRRRCMGSFLSLDLIVFFFFFELTLVPAYFIIAGWGHERRAYAAVKFFLYTFLGSAFLLVGILTLAFIHQSQTGVLTFSLPALEHTHLSSSTEILLFLAFTVGLRGQGAALPFPHVVTRRLHRGAGRRLGHPVQRAGQVGDLRDHPLRPHPVPPGHPHAGPAHPDPGRHRHRLRRHRGLRPARHEAAGGVLLAGPDRLHRPGDLRPEHPGPVRRRAAHAQPRPDRGRRSSSSSGSSTSAGARGR